MHRRADRGLLEFDPVNRVKDTIQEVAKAKFVIWLCHFSLEKAIEN